MNSMGCYLGGKASIYISKVEKMEHSRGSSICQQNRLEHDGTCSRRFYCGTNWPRAKRILPCKASAPYMEFTGKFGKKRLSDKEYSRRMKEGCCYNCGRKGHRAQDCSSRFNARKPEDETKKKASKVASVSTNRGKSKEKFRKTTMEDANSHEFEDISSSSEEDSGKE